MQDYLPVSDPIIFFNDAQNLATDNSLGSGSEYVAIFPYIYAYDVALGGAMKLLGGGLLSVIILNTLLDVAAAILLYILVKKVSRNTKTAKLAAFLWIASPFNIIFSALSLPIIAVNTCLIASVLFVYLAISNMKNLKRLVPLSIATGMVFAISNAFRPMMIVLVVAVVVYYLIFLLKNHTLRMIRSMVISLSLILASFFSLNIGYTYVVSAATNYPPTTNSGGWSVYVGANYETWGRWNPENGYFSRVIDEEPTITAAQDRMLREGIDRWKQLSPLQLIDFIIKKSIVIGGDQYHMIYNLSSYPNLWARSNVINLLYFVCAIYSYILILLTAAYFIRTYRKKGRIGFEHFLALAFVGLFLAFLCVEVANRYFMPFFVSLTIFTALGLGKNFRKAA
jgi:hypothetical protein